MQSKENDRAAGKPRRGLAARIFKILGITVGALVLLFAVLITVAIWILNPERLTPLVSRVATENLNAEVKLDRAELTFWGSFPHLRVEVDNLQIISHSLDSLRQSGEISLPADADSLLSVGGFTGSVNVLRAITGRISLNDVVISRPRINLLKATATESNFDIFYPTPDDTTKTRSSLPNISINHFAVVDALPITYRSITDSVDVALMLNTVELNDRGLPLYELNVATRIETPMLKNYSFESIPFNLDGNINWDGDDPYKVDLDNVTFGIEDFSITANAAIEFYEDLKINSLDVAINRFDVSSMLRHVPAEYASMVAPLQTDMKINASAQLTRPLVLGESMGIPYMDVAISIPDCYVKYQTLDWRKLALDVLAQVDGSDLNRTVIDVKRFIIDGKALDIDFNCRLTDLISDPHVSGHFSGMVDFTNLPKVLADKIGAKISGSLDANTDFKLHVSDLDSKHFHRIYAKGDVSLHDFSLEMGDSAMGAYTRLSRLEFGSSETMKHGEFRKDSVLVVKLDIDTASFYTDGVKASLHDFRAAFGTDNRFSSTDSTQINPFGGGLHIGRLTYISTIDSMRMRLTDASGMASLRRYEGDAKLPQLGLRLNAKRLRVRNTSLSASLRQTTFDVKANLQPRRQPRHDSGVDRHRSSHGDSISARAMRARSGNRMASEQIDTAGAQLIDFNVDNSIKSLLRRWNVRGQVTAASGRLRLPQIRLRNSFKDLDLAFTTDSIALHNLDYRLGQSDFKVVGAITNIKRALSSRRPQPLKIDFSVSSDTINVNQIIHALSNPIVEKLDSDKHLAEDWADEEIKEIEEPEETPDSIMGPILVPLNIDAGFKIAARNVVYTDLQLKDFAGELLVYGGVVNLHQLHASTEIGNLDVSAIYAAPTADDMSFALGMDLEGFRIDRLHNVVPAIDTIMPMMKSFSGIVNAQVAVTSDLSPDMYLKIPTLRAAMKFDGDSLVVFDSDTYRKLAKWLLFKDKNHNMIDRLSVQLTVEDGVLNLYPFYIDIDRYRLGVMGHNDLDLNLNYHIAVLRSPIPFKFGINIKGTPDHLKFRLGGAKFKDQMVAERDSIAGNTRINLLREMNNAFRRGVRAARLAPLQIKGNTDTAYMLAHEENLTHADSLLMMEEGLIARPDTLVADTIPSQPKKPRKNGRRK